MRSNRCQHKRKRSGGRAKWSWCLRKSIAGSRPRLSDSGAPCNGFKKLVAEAGDPDFPPMPPLDDKGCYPAREAIRIGLARTIIERRKAAGWTQEQLARAAGVRQETVSRLETGKHSPNVRTVDKIDLALKNAGF